MQEGRKVGRAEGGQCPAVSSSPLPVSDLMGFDADDGPMPMHGPGALTAIPVALALPCPERDGKRLDRGSGNCWICVEKLYRERSNSSSSESRLARG